MFPGQGRICRFCSAAQDFILLKNRLPIPEQVLHRRENKIYQDFFIMISIYLSNDFVQTTNTILGKTAQTIIPPPPCFIVVFRHLWRYSSPCFLLTDTGLSLTRQNLLSSVKRTLLQSKSIYSRAHAKRFLCAAVLRRCFLLALQYFSPLVCRLLLTVLALTLILYSFLRSFDMAFDVFLLFLRLKCFMILPSRVVVIIFLPLPALSITDPVSLYFPTIS